MVSALDSGSSGLRSSPGLGHCVVFYYFLFIYLFIYLIRQWRVNRQ